MTKWIKHTGPDRDIIISSRIRLARNMDEFPFPVLLNKEQGMEIIKSIGDVINNENNHIKEDFQFIILDKIPKMERQILVEKHLISPALMENYEKSGVLLNHDESISVMINEEDHIRIQCVLPGFQLKEAWDVANEVDDILEGKINYAFDEKLGYLTSCPTNLGTGMRASVMVHLPALNMTGYINRILQAASQMGLAVRGIYGEGTEVIGNIFQISNQLTLGRSEEEIIGNLKDVTRQIVQKERDGRNTLLLNNRIQLEDKIYRSYGILKSARVLTTQECMKRLSDVRLGVDLEILKGIEIEDINEMMIMVQPAYLQKMSDSDLNTGERDIKRAELVRQKLGNIQE